MASQPQAYIPTHVWNGLGPLQARIDAQNARKYEAERENYRLGTQLAMQNRQMDEAARQRGEYMGFLNRQLEAKKQAEQNAQTKADEAEAISNENAVNLYNAEADSTLSNLNTELANLEQIEAAIRWAQTNVLDPQVRDQLLKKYERDRLVTIQLIQEAGKPYGIQLGKGGVSGRYKLTSPNFRIYDRARKLVIPTKVNPFGVAGDSALGPRQQADIPGTDFITTDSPPAAGKFLPQATGQPAQTSRVPMVQFGTGKTEYYDIPTLDIPEAAKSLGVGAAEGGGGAAAAGLASKVPAPWFVKAPLMAASYLLGSKAVGGIADSVVDRSTIDPDLEIAGNVLGGGAVASRMMRGGGQRVQDDAQPQIGYSPQGQVGYSPTRQLGYDRRSYGASRAYSAQEGAGPSEVVVTPYTVPKALPYTPGLPQGTARQMEGAYIADRLPSRVGPSGGPISLPHVDEFGNPISRLPGYRPGSTLGNVGTASRYNELRILMKADPRNYSRYAEELSRLARGD